MTSRKSKNQRIYTQTSLTCKETWKRDRADWCVGCERGYNRCLRQVLRMSTEPDCPVHASVFRPKRTSSGRVVYRHFDDPEGWYASCLSTREVFECNRRYDELTDDEAIHWLLTGQAPLEVEDWDGSI